MTTPRLLGLYSGTCRPFPAIRTLRVPRTGVRATRPVPWRLGSAWCTG